MAKEKPVERNFKSVSNASPFFNFKNDGDFIEGYYTASKEIRSKFGDKQQKIYDLKTEKGNFAVGGTGLLNWLMEKVALGSFIRIVYKGKKEIKNQKGQKIQSRQWEVLVDENETPVEV